MSKRRNSFIQSVTKTTPFVVISVLMLKSGFCLGEDTLEKRIGRQLSEDFKGQASEELKKLGPQALPPILTRLDAGSTHWEVGKAIVFIRFVLEHNGVSNEERSVAINRMIEKTKATTPELREAILSSTMHFKDKRWLDFVEGYLKDADAKVQLAALRVLRFSEDVSRAKVIESALAERRTALGEAKSASDPFVKEATAYIKSLRKP